MIDFIVVQIALLFIPGLIWAIADFNYGKQKLFRLSEIIVKAFLFGVLTYFALGLLYFAYGCEFDVFEISPGDPTWKMTEILDEILWSIPTMLFLLFFWLLGVNYRWLVRILGMIRLTKRDGSQDVWTYTLNSNEEKYKFVRIVDLQTKLVYAGWILAYSESEGFRELLLEHVEVLDLNYNLKIKLPTMYISRPKSEILLEFPINPNVKENKSEEIIS